MMIDDYDGLPLFEWATLTLMGPELGLFPLSPHWIVSVDAHKQKVSINNEAWSTPRNEGWVRPSTPEEIARFCGVLRTHRDAFEIIFDLVFDNTKYPPRPGGSVLYEG